MDDLSPSAQAVLDAFFVKAGHTFPLAVAASLRAAVDKVLPPELDLPPAAPDAGHIRQNERRLVRLRLRNIAIELENNNVQ